MMRGAFIFKQILLNSILVWSLLPTELHAQRECGTPSPAFRRFFPPEQLQRSAMTDPVHLGIVVHVFANDNGNNRAATDSLIMVQLENMKGFYAPFAICFTLLGIEQINNTDLLIHDVDEESELIPFLVPNTIDLFIHGALMDGNDNLNGSAYGIPNTYFSVVGSAMMSSTNLSTTAHEMGHCLGLYHTFQGGDENAARTGNCANCTVAGDGLCDTEADPHSDTYDTGNFIDTVLCNYFGTVTDNCNALYVMDPHNIMAYGWRPCRDIFTAGQGALMLFNITYEPSLNACITPQYVNFSPVTNETITSGLEVHVANQSITIEAIHYEINGQARGYFGAPSITVMPNVRFAPGTGSVAINAQYLICD